MAIGPLPIGPTVKNHFHDAGLSEFCDPAEYCSASYWPDPLANLEPFPDHATPYRAAAIGYLQVLHAMDEFLTAADVGQSGHDRREEQTPPEPVENRETQKRSEKG
jgi:hypothetical protein